LDDLDIDCKVILKIMVMIKWEQGQGLVARCCDNATSGFTICKDFLGELRNYQFYERLSSMELRDKASFVTHP
jgi:hypothetical protein